MPRPPRPPSSLKAYLAATAEPQDRNGAYHGTGSKRYPCNHCRPYVLVTIRNGAAAHAELHHQWSPRCKGEITVLDPHSW